LSLLDREPALSQAVAPPPAASAAALLPSSGAAPQEASPGDAGLFRKLVWLTLFRLVMVTVLLGATAVVTWGAREAGGEAAPLYGLILATYLVSLAFALLLRWRRWLGALAYAQVALDVAIASQVVALTGYADSVFVFMYLLGIVNGAILLYRRGALAAAGLAVAAYIALALAQAAPGAPGPPLFKLFVHGSAFLATAALASYLAEQLKRTGQRLEESQGDLAAITALHEAIVQSVASGLLTLDQAGRITFLNRAGEQITGLAASQVSGAPAARHFPAFRAMTLRDEADFVSAHGEKLRLGYTTFPLLRRGGEQIGTAVIFQDLTELRAMEEAVRRSQRLADLGRVAAGLAHELRNPLASMSGCIEILRADASLGEQDLELMDIVLREATRLNHLVTRFLEFTRPAPPVREPADLSRIVAETLDVFANDPAAQAVRLERALEPAPVACDADQMRQVLWNLLANAAQAVASRDGAEPRAAAGGVIRIRCAPGPGGGAQLTVADDGPGIAPADLPRIFTPFFTTKEEGTGLGLATVQRIVDAHGGAVQVDSSPGKGTTFMVQIPGRPRGAVPRVPAPA
jgi:two-component system sensor histidine kinase PilS (NtrC family)